MIGWDDDSDREARQDAEEMDRLDEDEDDTETRMREKAREDHVTLVPLGGGVYSTRSSKTPFGITYTTTVDACSCPATVAICKHIAAVRAKETERAEYWARVREQRRQSAASRQLMADVEQTTGRPWRTVTGSGRIGQVATFHRKVGAE